MSSDTERGPEPSDPNGTSLTELAAPSEVGLLALALGAAVKAMLKRRRSRAQVVLG